MQAAEPCKFGVGQSRNRSKDARLLAMFEFGLETHHVEDGAESIVLAELHYRVGFDLWTMGICQPKRFHRAMPQRFVPPLGHHFDRQTAVEIWRRRFEVVKC